MARELKMTRRRAIAVEDFDGELGRLSSAILAMLDFTTPLLCMRSRARSRLDVSK